MNVMGCGTAFYGYRALGDGTFSVIRWTTLLYFPLFPLGTWHIRPLTASGTFLGAAVVGETKFEMLGKLPTSLGRVLWTYSFGWVIVPLVALGPALLIGNFWWPPKGDKPSILQVIAMTAAAIWMLVVIGYLVHREERLYEWKD